MVMKLNNTIMIGIACALLAIPSFAGEVALPEINVPRMQVPPAIDGKIDSNEWANAAEIHGFVDYLAGEKKLAHQTICRVGRGSDSLYVAFECKDDNTGNRLRSVTQRDGHISQDDSIEVFLSTTSNAKTYYHFCVDVNGTQYDACGWDSVWDGYWIARTSVGKDAWYAELKIPYSTLGISSGTRLDSSWRANFCREFPKRSGGNAEISCWSPTFGGFHSPEKFGLLRGMNIDSRYLVLSPVADINCPKRWLIGRNDVELSLKNLSGSPSIAQVACIDPETGATLDKRTVRIGGSSETKLKMPLDLPKRGDYKRKYVVFNSAGEVISASRVLHARANILDCTLVSPAFRGNIQSKDPEKEILINGVIGIASKQKLTVVAALRPVGKTPIWRKSVEASSGGAFKIKRSASDLPVGDYDLDISLLDASGKNLGMQSHAIHVLAPAPEEVTFDRNGICYINGKPFFPIGLYHVSRTAVNVLNDRGKQIGLPMLNIQSVISDVKDHGFNTLFSTQGMPDDEYLRIAKDAGLYVIPEVNFPSASEFSKYRETADRFGNILLWYGFDEAAGERMQRAADAYRQYKREDAHRPFSGAVDSPALFDSGAEAFDILMMDPYFVGIEPLSVIGRWIDQGFNATKGAKPIWVIPQAFTIDGMRSAEPTPAQLRCQAYISIVHGATGLVWYAYWTSEPWSKNLNGRNQWHIADTPLWPYFKTLNAEINNLVPVITTGKSLGRLYWSDKSIHSVQWEYNGIRYIIAVNPTDKSITCSLGGLAGRKADVISENRTVSITDGEFSDTFRALEVHLYKYSRK